MKRMLGTIEVSPIGMGCMGFSHGYGEIPDHDYSVNAIRQAHEFGCTFFDTAEAYGPDLLPENRGAWNVTLTDEEFKALEAALDQIPVHGHRGFVEQQGGGMKNWGRK